jgi:hemoglobin
MSLYADLGGFDALLAVCVRWHELCSADPLARHPFEHITRHHHDERLAAYLAEATGGPELYTAGYADESEMQRLHAGQGVHREVDEACLALFDRAIEECGVPAAAGERLSAYFRRATRAMEAYGRSADDVPDGLALLHA